MKTSKIMPEEFYNPSGYADYLENEHYHHSDKGCQIEIAIEMGTRPGELPCPGVVKKCLTHSCVCSKTGWEKGFYNGTDSRIPTCQCGKELEGKNHLCHTCKERNEQESRNKFYLKRKHNQDFVRRMRMEKIAKNTNVI